jgi:hypothetical protein
MRLKRTDTNADVIAEMDRDALTRAILSIECEFPVDLTEESLRPLSLEKLRHVYAALLRHGKQPDG